MFFVRKRSASVAAATYLCLCKAKRQQYSTDAGQLAVIAWMR
ncbi:hypothetical protein [Lysinibacillus sp. CTST325]